MNNKKIRGYMVKSLFLASLALFACSRIPSKQTVAKKTGISKLYQNLEFKMPKVVAPTFPDYRVSITEFGAVPGGLHLNTQAFAKAIRAVEKKGGGTVVIPRGLWLTGPIELKSNINLHADKGALIVFSENRNLYPLVRTGFEGLNTVRCMSPIYGKDLTNIAITGKGVFDGNGQAWRMVRRSKVTSSQWKKLVASGGVVNTKKHIWYPSKSSELGAELSDHNVPLNFKSMKKFEKIKDFLRPVMVDLVDCKNVLLEGVVFKNSPAWCIHPLRCENLIVRDLTVKNPWNAQNGDGIDIESSKNCLVYNSTFSTGDDGICIKSGKNEPGHTSTIPTQNVIIENCIVYRAHGGFVIGSEMSGGVKNVKVSNCTFDGTDTGLRFKSKRGRGGVVQDIYISNINMLNIRTNAIIFNMHYGWSVGSGSITKKSLKTFLDEPIPKVNKGTPVFKNIFIRNISCYGAQQAVYLQGLPEKNLQNVSLKNVTIKAKNGLFCMDASGITIKGLHLETQTSPQMIILNSRNIKLDNISLSGPAKPLISILGPRTANIKISGQNSEMIKKYVDFENGAKPGSLSISKN